MQIRKPDNENHIGFAEQLLIDAMKAGHIETKTKVIIVALEEFIRKNRIAGLKRFKGKVDLDINIDRLRGRNTGLN